MTEFEPLKMTDGRSARWRAAEERISKNIYNPDPADLAIVAEEQDAYDRRRPCTCPPRKPGPCEVRAMPPWPTETLPVAVEIHQWREASAADNPFRFVEVRGFLHYSEGCAPCQLFVHDAEGRRTSIVETTMDVAIKWPKVLTERPAALPMVTEYEFRQSAGNAAICVGQRLPTGDHWLTIASGEQAPPSFIAPWSPVAIVREFPIVVPKDQVRNILQSPRTPLLSRSIVSLLAATMVAGIGPEPRRRR